MNKIPATKYVCTIVPEEGNAHSKLSSKTLSVIDDLWEESYKKKRGAWFTIISNSMAPLIGTGDKIHARWVEPHTIKFGDIIIFKTEKWTVTHRVIRKYNNLKFLQKGDNTLSSGIISDAAILGKVVAVKKGHRLIDLDTKLQRFFNYLLAIHSLTLYLLDTKSPIIKHKILGSRSNRTLNIYFQNLLNFLCRMPLLFFTAWKVLAGCLREFIPQKPETRFQKRKTRNQIPARNLAEDELLLGAIGTGIDKGNIDYLLKNHLDWDYILKRGLSHRIAPILYHSFSRHKLTSHIPGRTLKILKKAYLYTLIRNMTYYVELKRILEAFKREDIEVLVLKGAALAETIYENIGLRHFSDVDLLVHKEDLAKVQNILENMEYSLYEGYRPEEFFRSHHFHLVYHKKSKSMNFCFEIHWNLVPPHSAANIDIGQLWRNASTIRISGLEAKTLSWEDTLWYLCLHNSTDAFHELLGFCDILRVMSRLKDKASFNTVIKDALKYNLKIPLFYSMLLSSKLFKRPTSQFEQNELRPNKVNLFFLNSIYTKRNIINQIFLTDWVVEPLTSLFMYEGLRYKLGFLLRYPFPQRKHLNKFYFSNPNLVTISTRITLFLKGIKVLVHMGWFLASRRVLWSSRKRDMDFIHCPMLSRR